MAHYVYYVYEQWGRGYIGSRSTKKDLQADYNYMGSFRDKSFKPTEKIILMEFDSGKEARSAEVLLHNFYEVAKNTNFANKAKQTSSGFSTEGTIGYWAGKERPEETKKKMKKKNKKGSYGMLGKTRKPESIEKFKQTMQLKSEKERNERLEKLRDAAIQQWNDPIMREKITSAQRNSKGIKS
jgi:hypothetical protein